MFFLLGLGGPKVVFRFFVLILYYEESVHDETCEQGGCNWFKCIPIYSTLEFVRSLPLPFPLSVRYKVYIRRWIKRKESRHTWYRDLQHVKLLARSRLIIVDFHLSVVQRTSCKEVFPTKIPFTYIHTYVCTCTRVNISLSSNHVPPIVYAAR